MALHFTDTTAYAHIDGVATCARIEQFNRSAHVTLWADGAGDDKCHDRCVTLETRDVWVQIGDVLAGTSELHPDQQATLRTVGHVFQLYGSADHAATLAEWRDALGQRQWSASSSAS